MPHTFRKFLRNSSVSGAEQRKPRTNEWTPRKIQSGVKKPLESGAGLTSGLDNRIWKSIPVALALVGPAGVLDWNSNCRTLLSSFVGGSPVAWRRWLEASVARLVTSGENSELLSTPADRSRSVEVSIGSDCTDDGCRIVTLLEATEGNKAQIGLAETVSTLSHELRTPLTSIKTSLNLVISEETGDLNADQAHFLGITMRNIERLNRLVDDLLDVARADAGQLVLRRQEVDLGALLTDTITLHESVAKNDGIDCITEPLPDSFIINIDPDKFVQMVSNVLGNAIKYTQTNGQIYIRLDERPKPDENPVWQLAREFKIPLEIFCVEIQDTGCGMSRTGLQQAFEPFQRSHDESSCTTPGAGLGLHITRGLVAAHGGTINLTSTVGVGTTASIRLPRNLASEKVMKVSRRLSELNQVFDTEHEGCLFLDLRDLGTVEYAQRLVSEFGEMCLSTFAERLCMDLGLEFLDIVPSLTAVATSDQKTVMELWQTFASERGIEQGSLKRFSAVADTVLENEPALCL